MLLHVKKQVATITGRIEVPAIFQPLQLNARVLAKSTNVVGCARITVCGNDFTRLHHVPPGNFAVEAQTHESSGPQPRQQNSPSDEGLGEMMQYSNCFDD